MMFQTKIFTTLMFIFCFAFGLEAQHLSFAEDADLIASFKSDMMTTELKSFQQKLHQDSIDYGLTSQQMKEQVELFMASLCNCAQMYTSVEADPNDPTKKKDRETNEEMISYLQSRTFGPGSNTFTHIVDGDALNCLSDCYNQVDQRNIRNGTVYSWNSVVSNTTILYHLETGKKFWAARTEEACWVAETYYVDKPCAADVPGVTGGGPVFIYVTDTLVVQLSVELQQSTGTYKLLEDVSVSLYPNPVSEALYIKLPATSEVDLSGLIYAIYTVSGQLVIETNETDIHISSLPAGQYVLRITDTDGDSPTVGSIQFQKF